MAKMRKTMLIVAAALLTCGLAWLAYDFWIAPKPQEVSLTLTGPAQLQRGEAVVYGVTVVNQGRGDGLRWQVRFTIPAGLVLAESSASKPTADLNVVAAGKTRQAAVWVKAAQVGDWAIEAELLVSGSSWHRQRLAVTVLAESEQEPAASPAAWQQYFYEHNGRKLLDFSSDHWLKLSVPEQQKYAQAYQAWYARTTGYPVEKELTAAGVVFVLRLMPPGRFVMGSPEQEVGRLKDEPQHRVVLPEPFYIGKYEVTQAQWLAIMGNNPAAFRDSGLLAPVEQVSWTDCQEFCQKTSLQLASEAQWEYACRAGVTTAYWFGDNAALLDRYAWFDENAGGFAHSVGQKPGNAWGCFDLHGNVWEWCQEWKGDYPAEEVIAPSGPTTGTTRVRRGCSWKRGAALCRSASRHGNPVERRSDCMGLRICVKIQ